MKNTKIHDEVPWPRQAVLKWFRATPQHYSAR